MSDIDEQISLIDPENPISAIPLPSSSASFVESETQYWNGKKLQPFDVMRRSAAYAMGLRYDRWRESDLKEWADSGIYSSMPNDIVIVLYLCSIPKASRPVKIGEGENAYWETPMTVPKVFSSPDAALAAAYEWAAKENIDFGKEGLPEAADIFLNIMRQIDAAKHKVVAKKEEGSPQLPPQSSAETSPNV